MKLTVVFLPLLSVFFLLLLSSFSLPLHIAVVPPPLYASSLFPSLPINRATQLHTDIKKLKTEAAVAMTWNNTILISQKFFLNVCSFSYNSHVKNTHKLRQQLQYSVTMTTKMTMTNQYNDNYDIHESHSNDNNYE